MSFWRPEAPYYSVCLLKVIFTWMKGSNAAGTVERYADEPQAQHAGEYNISMSNTLKCTCDSSKTRKRKHSESSFSFSDSTSTHPIDEILLWHSAIKRELLEITDEVRKIQVCGDFMDLSSFNERLQFIAEVCIFHR